MTGLIRVTQLIALSWRSWWWWLLKQKAPKRKPSPRELGEVEGQAGGDQAQACTKEKPFQDWVEDRPLQAPQISSNLNFTLTPLTEYIVDFVSQSVALRSSLFLCFVLLLFSFLGSLQL